MELACTDGDISLDDDVTLSQLDKPRSNWSAHRRNVIGLKSVTNLTGFKHIFYYPVSIGSQVTAILEVGYKNSKQVQNDIYTPQVSRLIE